MTKITLPPASTMPAGLLNSLEGKRGLVIGVANDLSIATGCARAFSDAGARLAVTWLNDKAKPHVEAAVAGLSCDIAMPCDLTESGQLEAVFDKITRDWGRLDFVLHSVAFAPREDLHGRVVDSSAPGFATAMDISCHSFLRMARLAEPLMQGGGCMLTVSYLGSERVIAHYNMMGPVKAALESAMRYMAAELGPKGIRAHALSPGPMRTRAASGIEDFDKMLEEAAARAPVHHLVELEDVGAMACFLVSDAARRITGTVIPIDGGQHLLGG